MIGNSQEPRALYSNLRRLYFQLLELVQDGEGAPCDAQAEEVEACLDEAYALRLGEIPVWVEAHLPPAWMGEEEVNAACREYDLMFAICDEVFSQREDFGGKFAARILAALQAETYPKARVQA